MARYDRRHDRASARLGAVFVHRLAASAERGDRERVGAEKEFMETIPQLLDDTMNHVEQSALDGFFESTTERTATVLRDWLGAN